MWNILVERTQLGRSNRLQVNKFRNFVAALKSVIAMHGDSHYSAPISRFSEN
jgi:hypothetical protein